MRKVRRVYRNARQLKSAKTGCRLRREFGAGNRISPAADVCRLHDDGDCCALHGRSTGPEGTGFFFGRIGSRIEWRLARGRKILKLPSLISAADLSRRLSGQCRVALAWAATTPGTRVQERTQFADQPAFQRARSGDHRCCVGPTAQLGVDVVRLCGTVCPRPVCIAKTAPYSRKCRLMRSGPQDFSRFFGRPLVKEAAPETHASVKALVCRQGSSWRASQANEGGFREKTLGQTGRLSGGNDC